MYKNRHANTHVAIYTTLIYLRFNIHLREPIFMLMLFYSGQDLDDMNIEIMRNTLYKAYLEDFFQFCQVRVCCPT